MKAFIAAVAVAIVMAVAASFVLDGQFQQASQDAFATDGVRLGN